MQAYQRNIRYPTHMLLSQWYGHEWWLVEDQNYTCTGEQRGEVLHMTLFVDIFSFIEATNTSMNVVSCLIILLTSYAFAISNPTTRQMKNFTKRRVSI